ncbi:uncharacterized protein TNCV_2881051 [Trichonephila clavipes]|nr:uncharacterized protein TNCV_2881051 [Trichonephila clavipes]
MRGHTVNIPFRFGIQGWGFARGLGLRGWNGACARWGLRVEGYRLDSGEGGGVSGQGKTLVPCTKVSQCVLQKQKGVWDQPTKSLPIPPGLRCHKEKIELREDLKSRRGLAVSLEIICHNCGESTSTMSSKISNKCYDVNLRLTYGMRAIGKGGAAARIFCGLMNLPPPPAKFERHNSLFLNVLKTISEDSMNTAVHEAVIANDNNSNIAVAMDGTLH